MLAAMLVATAAVALTLGFRDGRNAGAGASAVRSPNVSVSDATLPLRSGYYELAAIGNRLLLTGGAYGGSPLTPGTCTATSVDPLTLKVTSTARGSCADPALYGRSVLPVSYVVDRHSPLFQLALKIAIVAPLTRAGYRLGSIVVRYPQCSDCGIEWIYGDGSLWVYDPWATPSMKMSARSGEMFRVSEQTGRVVQRWRMPTFSRSLLAVDDDGLWIAQSTFGGTPAPAQMTGTEARAYRSLYRFVPGMSVPDRPFLVGAGGYWMVAAGHSVWIDASQSRGASHLWHLTGTPAHPALRARPVASGDECYEMGEGQPSTVGDSQTGIYCVDLTESGGHIQRFDAVTGAPRQIADSALGTNSQQDEDDGAGPAVALGRSDFFLVGENRLFRVATS